MLFKIIPAIILIFPFLCNGYAEKNLFSRVVSLSPSITRQIIDMDKSDVLVGVTSYHPPLEKDITIVGSLINPDLELIYRLKPTLVLFSREDSAVQKLDRLKSLGLKCHMFGANNNFSDICRNYMDLGRLLDCEKQALKKVDQYKRDYNSFIKFKNHHRSVPSVFLLSEKPLVTVSGKTYIHEIMTLAGYQNSFMDLQMRYAPISMEALVLSKPEVIIIASGTQRSFLKERIAPFVSSDTWKPEIYNISQDNISYYTPSDFIASVVQLKRLKRDQKGK